MLLKDGSAAKAAPVSLHSGHAGAPSSTATLGGDISLSDTSPEDCQL